MPQDTVSPGRTMTDEEYRQLEAQHHQFESRLGELAEKAVLSDEEQVEESTLKKKKLQLKDRMQEIARRGLRHLGSRGRTALRVDRGRAVRAGPRVLARHAEVLLPQVRLAAGQQP